MTVRSAQRVLELLELMAQQSQAVSLAEIHRMVDLPKSSTLMLIRTLQQRGYLARDDAGNYRLVRLPGEGSADAPAWGTLVRLATPWLTEAVAAVGESGFIAVLTHDDHVRYLNKILPDARELRYDRNISVDRIAHQVASGVALLAAQSDDRIEAYLTALPPQSPAGPDRPEAIRAAIQAVRASGIAVNLAGRVEGAAGVAVAVRGPAGHPVAAVNLAGPVERIKAELPAIKRAAQTAAARIGEALARRTPVSGRVLAAVG
ncbi:MAG TPA: IclR family transcriptional regulator C-terminal domain-containing protein [Aliidongia sp.]|uniref:IclR family transcriptional regulator n=1 Tax=Aliidongia sp. TaxID=1914230 RepID=UPI002DDD9944|nr:IclR family transcriptional regulator C-terminal domain-containing protein [Aliidongia sp.]HEV2676396.1 IclR family transcriptional regulator C-terminal domain-containing protein [Aliidongia sp.]